MGLLPGLGEGHHYVQTFTSRRVRSPGSSFFSHSWDVQPRSACSQRDAPAAFAPASTPEKITKGTKSFFYRWVSSTIRAVNPHPPLLHTWHKLPKTQRRFPGSESNATKRSGAVGRTGTGQPVLLPRRRFHRSRFGGPSLTRQLWSIGGVAVGPPAAGTRWAGQQRWGCVNGLVRTPLLGHLASVQG